MYPELPYELYQKISKSYNQDENLNNVIFMPLWNGNNQKRLEKILFDCCIAGKVQIPIEGVYIVIGRTKYMIVRLGGVPINSLPSEGLTQFEPDRISKIVKNYCEGDKATIDFKEYTYQENNIFVIWIGLPNSQSPLKSVESFSDNEIVQNNQSNVVQIEEQSSFIPSQDISEPQVAEIPDLDNEIVQNNQSAVAQIEEQTSLTPSQDISEPQVAEMSESESEQEISIFEDVEVELNPNVSSLLAVLGNKELSTNEMLNILKQDSRTVFKNKFLKIALDKELVEMTEPHNPKSRTQKYRLTQLGKTALEKLSTNK